MRARQPLRDRGRASVTWARPPIAAQLVPSWVKARCELGGSLFEYAGALYDSWREYARDRGSEPGSPSEFAHAMEQHGFQCDRLPTKRDGCFERRRIRWGLRLRLSRGEGEKFSDPSAPGPPSPSFGDFFRKRLRFQPNFGDGEPLRSRQNVTVNAPSQRGKTALGVAEAAAAGVVAALRRPWPLSLSAGLAPIIIFQGSRR